MNPKLTDHKILYKGRRFWIFEIDPDHPFEGHEEHCRVIVYDKAYQEAIGFCDLNLDGYLTIGTFQDSMQISGPTPRDLVESAKKALKLFEHLMR